MSYYVSVFGQWDTALSAVTIDGALILAETRSKYPMPGTESVYEKWAVWEPVRTGNAVVHNVRAIALMGKAKWVEKCAIGCCRAKFCECAGIGWKETGQDRG